MNTKKISKYYVKIDAMRCLGKRNLEFFFANFSKTSKHKIYNPMHRENAKKEWNMLNESNSILKSFQKRSSTIVEPFTISSSRSDSSKKQKISSWSEYCLCRRKCFLPCYAWILLGACYVAILAAIATCITC